MQCDQRRLTTVCIMQGDPGRLITVCIMQGDPGRLMTMFVLTVMQGDPGRLMTMFVLCRVTQEDLWLCSYYAGWPRKTYDCVCIMQGDPRGWQGAEDCNKEISEWEHPLWPVRRRQSAVQCLHHRQPGQNLQPSGKPTGWAATISKCDIESQKVVEMSCVTDVTHRQRPPLV